MRKTQLDQVEMRNDGSIGVRIRKSVEDNGEELAFEWHRTFVSPDVDVAEQMSAVNEHLKAMGYPPLAETDIEYINNLRNVSK